MKLLGDNAVAEDNEKVSENLVGSQYFPFYYRTKENREIVNQQSESRDALIPSCDCLSALKCPQGTKGHFVDPLSYHVSVLL